MIIKQKEIAITELCPDSLAYFSEDSLLFDIETTGFSSKTAYLYMIGCITNRNGILSISQYLAQKKEEEEGHVFVIRTSEKVTVGREEKNKEKLEHLYQLGLEDGKKSMEAMKKYLEQ